jgi:hypothetical protein
MDWPLTMATGVCEFAAAAGISAATKLEVEETTQYTTPANPTQAPFKNSFFILIALFSLSTHTL